MTVFYLSGWILALHSALVRFWAPLNGPHLSEFVFFGAASWGQFSLRRNGQPLRVRLGSAAPLLFVSFLLLKELVSRYQKSSRAFLESFLRRETRRKKHLPGRFSFLFLCLTYQFLFGQIQICEDNPNFLGKKIFLGLNQRIPTIHNSQFSAPDTLRSTKKWSHFSSVDIFPLNLPPGMYVGRSIAARKIQFYFTRLVNYLLMINPLQSLMHLTFNSGFLKLLRV